MRCDSCAYASIQLIHLKAFLCLCAWADLAPISRRCDGNHSHVQAQGKYTKQSATYVEDPAEALAQVMASGIRRLAAFDEEVDIPRAEGFESQLVNELSCSLLWEVDHVRAFEFPLISAFWSFQRW